MKYYERTKRERRIETEIRAIEEDGNRYIIGLIPYESRSEDMGFYEVINQGAFTKTIMESQRIFALWSHDDKMVLGNTENGSLELEDTPAGLIARVKLNDTSFAKDAWEQISTGNVRTMSFGFSTIKEKYDHETNTRHLLEVRLYEVSFGVPFPAYSETVSIGELRSMVKNLNDEDRKYIIDSIRQIIEEAEPKQETTTQEPSNDTQERSNISLFEAKLKYYMNKEGL